MARIRLITWDPAHTEEGRALLAAEGHDATVGPIDRFGVRVLARNRPDVIVVDVSHESEHARRVLIAVAKHRRLRHVPLLITGADGLTMAKLTVAAPEATFTTWPHLADAVTRALAR